LTKNADCENFNKNGKDINNNNQKTSNCIVSTNIANSKKVTLRKNSKKVKKVPSKLSMSTEVKENIAVEKYLNIFYFNARSIRNKIDELKILAEQYKPDLIGVVETWLNDDNFACEINLSGYNILRKDSKIISKPRVAE